MTWSWTIFLDLLGYFIKYLWCPGWLNSHPSFFFFLNFLCALKNFQHFYLLVGLLEKERKERFLRGCLAWLPVSEQRRLLGFSFWLWLWEIPTAPAPRVRLIYLWGRVNAGNNLKRLKYLISLKHCQPSFLTFQRKNGQTQKTDSQKPIRKHNGTFENDEFGVLRIVKRFPPVPWVVKAPSSPVLLSWPPNRKEDVTQRVPCPV